MIKLVAYGYNASVFAHGQTGSGKTHTMTGPLEQQKNGPGSFADSQGIIPRAVCFFFEELNERADADSTFKFNVTATYLQIYNGQITDLLQNSKSKTESLQIREIALTARDRRNCTPGRPKIAKVRVEGVSEHSITCYEDIMSLLEVGSKNRFTRATAGNEESSRSHAILQLTVRMEYCGPDGKTVKRQSKLSFIDLAGSEKSDTWSDPKPEHVDELKSINKSLTALGTVVANLQNKKGTEPIYIYRIETRSSHGSFRTA